MGVVKYGCVRRGERWVRCGPVASEQDINRLQRNEIFKAFQTKDDQTI
jgi:hypothetical protein